ITDGKDDVNGEGVTEDVKWIFSERRIPQRAFSLGVGKRRVMRLLPALGGELYFGQSLLRNYFLPRLLEADWLRFAVTDSSGTGSAGRLLGPAAALRHLSCTSLAPLLRGLYGHGRNLARSDR